MTNLGSAKPRIDGARISGNYVVAEISGEFVFVITSGLQLWCDVSGDPVTISGNYVTWSSGLPVSTSISGQYVELQSGQNFVVEAWTPHEVHATDSGNIAVYYSGTAPYHLENVTCKFASLPYGSGNEFKVSLYPPQGALYNTVLYAVDPHYESATSILVTADSYPYMLMSGDVVAVTYTNISGIAYGLRLTYSTNP